MTSRGRRLATGAWLLAAGAWLAAGCRPAAVAESPVALAKGTAAGEEPPFRLAEVSREAGLHFTHAYGSRTPITIVETMGGGAAFLDFDGDGWQDVFLVSSGQDFQQPKQTPGSKLFRNTGNGRFEDVTANSGLVIDGYAVGCCAGDFDNDDRTDLAVTGYGQNWLFRNLGGGRFEDVTARSGLLRRPKSWGIGCAFLDVNRDGLLDLYIGNYVVYDPKIPFCMTADVLHGCTPNQYTTQRNELYINRGNGRFEERAEALGAADPEGASLGIVMSDFDVDGWTDLYIANDGTPNTLLHNVRGRFQNVAQQAGVAYGEDGVMRAGMGTDAGDIDGDGLFEMVITNFSNEVTTVYRNDGKLSFTEVSYPSGVGTPSRNHLKFGIVFADLDLDGRQDLYQGNGHVHDTVEKFNDLDTFEQVDQVYLCTGPGRFAEVQPSTGAFPKTLSVTRAVTTGDWNNDGRTDLLINSLGRPARLLENRTPYRGPWVGLKLVGRKSNRSALGARVELRGPDGLQVREVRSGGSYIGQADPRVLFNLKGDPAPESLSVRIRWPGGREQKLPAVTPGRYVTVEEPA